MKLRNYVWMRFTKNDFTDRWQAQIDYLVPLSDTYMEFAINVGGLGYYWAPHFTEALRIMRKLPEEKS